MVQQVRMKKGTSILRTWWRRVSLSRTNPSSSSKLPMSSKFYFIFRPDGAKQCFWLVLLFYDGMGKTQKNFRQCWRRFTKNRTNNLVSRLTHLPGKNLFKLNNNEPQNAAIPFVFWMRRKLWRIEANSMFIMWPFKMPTATLMNC